MTFVKTQLLAVLAGVCFSTSAFALNQAKIDQFKANIEAALKAKDTTALDRLCYTKDADPVRIDLPSSDLAFKDAFANDTFDSVQVLPLDDPSLSAKEVQFATQAQTENGRRYTSNLQPVALCKIVFKPSWTMTEPLGLDPAGDLKVVEQKLAGGTAIFSLGQTKLDEFKAALEAALKARDLNALGFLFYTKGVSQSGIDSQIAAFERDLATGTLDSVLIQSFDDPLPHGISANPEAIKPPAEGKPTIGGGFPNLKPVRLCIINFKTKEHEQGGFEIMWVGIDPEGQYKFVINV